MKLVACEGTFRFSGLSVKELAPEEPLQIIVEGLTSLPVEQLVGLTRDGRATLWNDREPLLPLGLAVPRKHHSGGLEPGKPSRVCGVRPVFGFADLPILDADAENPPSYGTPLYSPSERVTVFGARVTPNAAGPFAIVRSARVENCRDEEGDLRPIVLAEVQVLDRFQAAALAQPTTAPKERKRR